MFNMSRNFISLVLFFTAVSLLSQCFCDAECKISVFFMPWNSIYEKVGFFVTVVCYDAEKSYEFDFGPYLNRTETTKTVTFLLGITCLKPAKIDIVNPSNIQRKNIISYLQVKGPCEFDLEGVVRYSKATDYRVQTIIQGAKMKLPNSSQELRHLLSKINKIGTLTLDDSTHGIPDIYVKYNWTYMAEVIFKNLSIKRFPKTLRYTMPRLQGLQLPYNKLKEPPDFPWDEEELSLPRNLTRKPVFNKQYEDGTNVKRNLYRRFLQLDFNKIQDLSDFEFKGQLHKLSIKGNGLRVIGRNSFVNLTKINSIDLSINRLNRLPEGIFRGLNELLHLRLNDNNISVITEDTFKDSTRLKTLYLNNNKIGKISQGLLLEHEELEELHLENNLIMIVEQGALPNNSNKLKNLYLNQNHLLTVPESVFLTRSLQNVYLANNYITFQGIVKTLDSIFFARLGNVLRKSVSETSLELRTDSIYIDLSNNNVRSIDVNGLDKEQMTKLKMVLIVFEINLKNNPLVCDCKALNLTRVLKKMVAKYSHIEERRFQSWICAEPRELKGKQVLAIPEEKFGCVMNLTGCPMEGMCFVRETDGAILVHIRNKNLRRLPLTMPIGAKLEIFLDNNQITELGLHSYLDNITVLHLSRNKIEQLNNSFVQRLTKIREFKIDSNRLKRLPRAIETLTSRKSFVNLAIHSNYLICDCHSKWMKEWLTNYSDKIYDIENVNCATGKAQGKPIYGVPLEEFICEKKPVDPGGNKNEIIIISTTLGALLVISTMVFVIVYFFRGEMKILLYTHFNWHPFDRVDDSDPSKIYDAFISYSSHDREWVHKELKQKLEENDPPYKICFHDRDFEVGAPIHDNIINSVNRSKRMIMVLSNSFLESEWCMLEFRAAHHKVLQDKTNYLIIILFEGIDTNALDDETRLYLRTNTYLSITNKWFWQKLLYSLPKPTAEPQEAVEGNYNLCLQSSSNALCLKIDENVTSNERENRNPEMIESKM